MEIREIDFKKIADVVDKCCKTEDECGACKGANCLVGFAKVALKYASQRGVYHIPQGPEMVPEKDLKLYYKEALTEALLQILLQCQNCRDNHQEECVINCTKKSIEIALLGDYIPYNGSALGYLIELSKRDSELGESLLEKYRYSK